MPMRAYPHAWKVTNEPIYGGRHSMRFTLPYAEAVGSPTFRVKPTSGPLSRFPGGTEALSSGTLSGGSPLVGGPNAFSRRRRRSGLPLCVGRYQRLGRRPTRTCTYTRRNTTNTSKSINMSFPYRRHCELFAETTGEHPCAAAVTELPPAASPAKTPTQLQRGL